MEDLPMNRTGGLRLIEVLQALRFRKIVREPGTQDIPRPEDVSIANRLASLPNSFFRSYLLFAYVGVTSTDFIRTRVRRQRAKYPLRGSMELV